MLNRLRAPHGAKKRKKVVGRGRGSGHGKTSGRGHKGQNARASGGVRPGFEGGQMPLIRRVPKRGFTFTPKAKYQLLSIEQLNAFSAGTEINPETLFKANLIDKKHKAVKILGDGELKHAVTVKAHAFSKSAEEKIQKSGGKAHRIPKTTPQGANAAAKAAAKPAKPAGKAK